MSSGLPTPSSGPAPSLYTLDDAVELLGHLVDAANVQNDLTRATNFLLMTGGPGGGPAGGFGGGMGDLFKKFFSRKTGHDDPSKGIGRYIKRKAVRTWGTSRPGRWAKKGGAFGRGLGKTLGGGSGALGKIGAVAGATVGALVTLVQSFVKARDAINDWTEAQFETARRLSAVSGSMASVVAFRDVGQLFRDMERGERTAGSAARLSEAEGSRKDEENKLAIAFDNATNSILAVLNNLLTPILKVLNQGVEMVNEISKTLGGPDLLEEDAMAVNTLSDIGADARAAVAKMDAAGLRLMDLARAAVRGAAAPAGAAPLGGIPGRIP